MLHFGPPESAPAYLSMFVCLCTFLHWVCLCRYVVLHSLPNAAVAIPHFLSMLPVRKCSTSSIWEAVFPCRATFASGSRGHSGLLGRGALVWGGRRQAWLPLPVCHSPSLRVNTQTHTYMWTFEPLSKCAIYCLFIYQMLIAKVPCNWGHTDSRAFGG